MIQLVEVTDDEDIYYDFERKTYIYCPRTRAFPHKSYEQWPSEEEIKQRKELKSKTCCCGMSKSGTCDGTHMKKEYKIPNIPIESSESFTRTEELTLEQVIERYGHVLTAKEIEHMKTFVTPQPQFQHPQGGHNVLK